MNKNGLQGSLSGLLESGRDEKEQKDSGVTVVTMDSVQEKKQESSGKTRRGGKRPGKASLGDALGQLGKEEGKGRRDETSFAGGTVDSRMFGEGGHKMSSKTKTGARRPKN